MLDKYDAWVEPWIPVEKNDGKTEELGIGAALKNAHKLGAVRAAAPTESFGIQRLLITILTDIYRPKHLEDLDDIYLSGRFDPDKIDAYYEMCQKEGSNFDLFDKKAPFLQYAFSGESLPELKPAANLFDELPTGNNVPHFVHKSETGYAFTPSRCLRVLCAIPHFEKHKRGKTVTTGINGLPPVYFLFNGNSLFETLAVSMPVYGRYENGLGLPVWRERGKINAVVPDPTLLDGLLSTPLKIRLKQSEDGLIRNVYMTEGTSYKDAKWKDPHVVYAADKKFEIKALTPKDGREIWRDTPVIASGGALSLLTGWGKREPIERVSEFIAYAKFSALKGTVFMPVYQYTDELQIPPIILGDSLKSVFYKNALDISEQLHKDCGNALKRTKKQIQTAKKDRENVFTEVLPPIFSKSYLSQAKRIFLDLLPDKLAEANTDDPLWEGIIVDFLVDAFRGAVISALNTALNVVSEDTAENLILKTLLRKNAMQQMKNIFKRGGYDKN